MARQNSGPAVFASLETVHKGGFKPVLSFWALVLFGLAAVGPTAPYAFFGIGAGKSHGHFALVYLIGMVAISFTALSYGRMASSFPEAGSTYTYASRALHPILGFFAGWAMILDYLLIPLISLIIVGVSGHKLIPEVPYVAWAVITALLVTAINLFGIEMTALATAVFNSILAVSVLWFVTVAVLALLRGTGRGALLSSQPFYNSSTFSFRAVMSATPIAVLSFLGFDGISTLAEDSKNARTNVARATVLVCLLAGFIFILQTYLGQLLWPDYSTFSPLETAFSDIARMVGGKWLSYLVVSLVVGQAVVAGLTSQASASRLLFGMSRDGRLPHLVFGYLHPRLNTPIYSMLLMAFIELLGALWLNLEEATDLVNFGACLGFMLVNLSVVRHYFLRLRERSTKQIFSSLLFPLMGFIVSTSIWLSISSLAFKIGFIWSALGLIYLGCLTHGFRQEVRETKFGQRAPATTKD
jgi:putrescine importer